MSSTSENETEILLGNRHLLAIFFVLAVLLGIAFTGGYMVGRNGTDRKPAVLSASATDPAASTSSMETHSLTPPADATNDTNTPSSAAPAAAEQTHTVQPPPPEPASPPKEDTPATPAPEETTVAPVTVPPAVHADRAGKQSAFSGPQSGQMFLQVAAVGHTEANGLANALSKKGFHAHAVAKPGANLYRVLIGPIRDTAELSSTRDSLRNAGFTKIFVQRF